MGDAGSGKGGACEGESVAGGTDVRSSSGPAAAAVDHLVVMVHGILGRLVFTFLIPRVLLDLSLVLFGFWLDLTVVFREERFFLGQWRVLLAG